MSTSLLRQMPSAGSESSDEELLQRVSQGDTRAFERFYDRHRCAAFAQAYRYCGTRWAAEEVVQDAFVKVWRSAHTFDASRGAARAWICAVIRHCALDEVRRHDRRSGHEKTLHGLEESLEASTRTDLQVERRERRGAVHDALMKLPVAQRRAVALSCMAGLRRFRSPPRREIRLGRSRVGFALARQSCAIRWLSWLVRIRDPRYRVWRAANAAASARLRNRSFSRM